MNNPIKMVADKLGNFGLAIDKHSPEILFGVGTVMVVTGTVMACKATTKAAAVKQGFQEGMEQIAEVDDCTSEEAYSKEDRTKDTAIVYTQTAVAYAKLYIPAVTTIGIGLAAFLMAHNILNKRLVAVTAAYKMVEASFLDYRSRVRDKYGEDEDRRFLHGVQEEDIAVATEGKDGKVKTVTKKKNSISENGHSVYARCFDDGSTQWSKDGDYNKQFLITQQAYANTLLQTRGHVFLNDVYDLLGFERTSAGAVVGWVAKNHSDESIGDDYIDFGIYDFEEDETRRKFVKSEENCVWLDFNVDGVMYDLI